MTPSPETGQPGETVRLVIPARADYLRLARITIAGIASVHGFDVESVDELRMAVDEACHLLVGSRWHGEGTITLDFSVENEMLMVDCRASLAGHRDAPPEYSEQILASLTDEYRCADDDSAPHVRFARRIAVDRE